VKKNEKKSRIKRPAYLLHLTEKRGSGSKPASSDWNNFSSLNKGKTRKRLDAFAVLLEKVKRGVHLHHKRDRRRTSVRGLKKRKR